MRLLLRESEAVPIAAGALRRNRGDQALGDRWLTGTPPLRLTHVADSGEIEQKLRCTICGEEVRARDAHYAAHHEQSLLRLRP